MDDTLNSHSDNRTKAATFYTASFVSAFSGGVTGPLYVVYLLFLHLTPIQIGIVLAAGRLATIAFEFPTGVFADRYGRKRSLLVSYAFAIVLSIGWFFGYSFTQALVLAIVSGIAYTFQSGAKESLMIKTMNLSENDDFRNHVFVRMGSWGNAGFVAGGLCTAALSFFALRSIWLAAALVHIVLILIYTFLVKERVRSTEREGREITRDRQVLPWSERITLHVTRLLGTGREAIRTAVSSRALVSLFGVLMCFSFVVALYGVAYPIYLKQTLHVPDFAFGLLGSISALVGIGGMLMGGWLSKRRGSPFALRVFLAVLAGLFLVFGFGKTAFVVITTMIIIEMMIHGWYPTYQSFFNKFVSEPIRASVLSLQSVVGLVAMMGGEVVVGIVLTHAPSPIVVQGAAFFLIISLFFLSRQFNTNQEAQPRS